MATTSIPAATSRLAIVSLAATGMAGLLVLNPFEPLGAEQRIALRVALAGVASWDSTALEEPLVISHNPYIAIERGTLSAPRRQPAGAAEGELATVGPARLSLEDATLVIGAPRPGLQSAPHSRDDARIAALSAFDFASLAVRRASLVYRDAGGVAFEIGSLTADVSRDGNGLLTTKMTIEKAGEKLRLDATLGARMQDRQTIAVALSGGLVEADLKGEIDFAAVAQGLKISAPRARWSTPSLSRLTRWLGYDKPAFADLGAAAAEGAFEWDGSGGVSFSAARFVLAGNRASGALSIGLSAARPIIDATLDFESLDLAMLLAGDADSPNASAPLERLVRIAGAADADLRLSARNLDLGGLKARRAAGTITIASQRISAHVAELETEWGSARGVVEMALEDDTPRLEVNGQLSGVVPGQSLLAGPAAISGRLEAAGGTLDEIVASLHGRGKIEIVDGGSLGLDLDVLLESGRGAWALARTGVTAVDQLSAELLAERGVVSTEALSLRSGASRYMANGRIDLNRRALDMVVSRSRPALRTGEAHTSMERDAVRIAGPLGQPSLTRAPLDDRAEAQPTVPHADGPGFKAEAIR